MVAQDNTASNQFAANTSKDRQSFLQQAIRTLLAAPIAYHRIFATVAGGAMEGLFLSQLYYWSQRTTLDGNWFYKSYIEWEQETALTEQEQRTARKKLIKLGILEEKKEGLPCKLFFRLNEQKLFQLIENFVAQNPHGYQFIKNNEQGNCESSQQNITNQNIKARENKASSDFVAQNPHGYQFVDFQEQVAQNQRTSSPKSTNNLYIQRIHTKITSKGEDARARGETPPLKTFEDFSNKQNAFVPEVKNNQQVSKLQEDASKQQDVVTPQPLNKQDLKGHRDISNTTEVKAVEDCNKTEDSEVSQNPHTIKIQVIEDSSNTGKGFRAFGNNQIPHEGKLAPDVFDKPEQKNKNKLTNSVEDFINRYEETGKIPNYGTEFKQWAMDEIGEVVKKYRKSGEILKGKPNDIDTSFLKHIAASSNKKGKPADFDIHNAFNWVVNAEKDPIRWQELTLLVTAWELSKITGKDNLNVVEEIENSGRMRVKRKLNIN